MNWIADASRAWWEWTSAMSMQITLLVAVVIILDRLLVRWVNPRVLMILWMTVIVKLIIPPAVFSATPIAQVADLPMAAPAVTEVSGGIPVVAFIVWAAGIAVLGLISTLQYCRLRRRWLQFSEEPPQRYSALVAKAARQIGLDKPVDVRFVSGVAGPAVVGFFQPIVVIPARLMTELSSEELQHVLMHEFAHIKRRDPAWTFICLIAQLVYWFHPLIWLARKRLALLREICCDHAVATAMSGTDSYRRTLLRIARRSLRLAPLEGLGFFVGRSQLLIRLEWLERRPAGNSLPKQLTAMLLVSLTLIGYLPLTQAQSLARFPAVADAPPTKSTTRYTPAHRIPESLAVAHEQGPNFEGLQGCLQLRYAVYGELSAETLVNNSASTRDSRKE